jgi:hypothetical protein
MGHRFPQIFTDFLFFYNPQSAFRNPKLNQNEGRLCFTFAHEAGHWTLHREHINQACRTGTDDAFIFCRTKDAKQKIEWSKKPAVSPMCPRRQRLYSFRVWVWSKTKPEPGCHGPNHILFLDLILNIFLDLPFY